MKGQSQSFRPFPIDVASAQSSRQIVWGYVFALLGAACFSSKAVFVKLAYRVDPDLDALSLLAIRMGLALPIYVLIGVWAYRQFKVDGGQLGWKTCMGSGLLGLLGYYVASLLDFTSLQYITAQLERLLLYTYPIFVIILGAIFMGKPITRIGILAVILAYSGIGLIFAKGSIASGANVALGVALVVGAALAFAVFQLLAPMLIKRIGSSLFTCVAMVSAGTGILIHYTINTFAHHGAVFANIAPQVWMIGVTIAIFATLLPSFLVNIALARVGSQAVSVVSMVSPLVTVVLAVRVLGEPFGLFDGIGTILTITGIGVYTWYDRKTKLEQGNDNQILRCLPIDKPIKVANPKPLQ